MICPCGTDLPFEDCCGPFHEGKRLPPTALALMRARYTAYVTGNIDYIFTTQETTGAEADRASTEAWSKNSEWLGLEIVSVEGGEGRDDTATVEFIARYKHKDEEHAHHEEASFRRSADRWILVDGKMQNSTFRRTTPKVKPNEPCPCGSGKKYKKCCGKP